MSVHAGAKVVLGARRLQELSELSKKIDPTLENSVAISTDASKPGEVTALLEAGFAKFGKINIVIVTVGTWRKVSLDTPIQEAGESGLTLVNSIVLPSWNSIFEATKFLKEHGGGAVLNLSSHVVLKGEKKLSGNTYYRAAKVAVENVVQSIEDIAGKEVSFVNLRPAIVDTPQNRKENPQITEEQWNLAVKPVTIFHWIGANVESNFNVEDPEFMSKLEL
jgi:NADP-dependent 3-hydroxy acid dehydrogenase YdfG